ncbi:MAG: flavin oxidoreductase [Phormidesmis priestleyi]|uniref:Flavin oxidoreductase n=1 Tax=Phormidesmis priestleyi TaxID=268141 RepID=A0A2W4X2L3_9CYAN|nr:MAG: flavin oxidoreductase [Phormidesmis priestleyi]
MTAQTPTADAVEQTASGSTRPRDVQVLPIAADTTVLRSRSWERLRFEIEYALEKGTTANSYLIRGNQIALLDPPGGSFTEIFLAALAAEIDPHAIDYIVLSHTNPNRIETLKALLALTPQATIICSNPGAIALQTADISHPIQPIKGGTEPDLDLGQGHHLQFILTPTPRWPDGLCTYDSYSEVLYSDKFFSAHLCSEDAYDLNRETLSEDQQYYFDCSMAPNARQVEAALDKFKDYAPRLYAVGHGPLIRYGVTELGQNYAQWAAKQKGQDLSVALIYASAYGNTTTIAQAIARGITKAGVSVESINAEQATPSEIKEAAEKSAGFIMGSPTLGGHAPTQIQTALGIVLSSASKNQLAGVFGSFGWSGEAIDLLESKFRDAGYRFGFEPIKVKFTPEASTLQECEQTGTDFAQQLKKAKKAQAPRVSASTVEKAIGRLVGSMCIVTAKQGNISGAMLASWVAQATFTPPGFTVAVAKDRAIEGLMHTGNDFVLNILAEGKHLGPMKHFLKPFGPGADRFAGVETTETEAGQVVLGSAAAYLECQVKNRMDCGDHWVIYATVSGGEVTDSNAKTAVHHRKTGTHY